MTGARSPVDSRTFARDRRVGAPVAVPEGWCGKEPPCSLNMLVATPAKTMSKRRRLMPRAASGQIVEVRRKRGKLFAIRFRAYGRRHYVTLDTTEDGWTRRRAREEFADVLAQVRLAFGSRALPIRSRRSRSRSPRSTSARRSG